MKSLRPIAAAALCVFTLNACANPAPVPEGERTMPQETTMPARSTAPIYESPDPASGTLTQIPADEPVGVLGQEDGWYHVEVGGITGWIPAEYLPQETAAPATTAHTMPETTGTTSSVNTTEATVTSRAVTSHTTTTPGTSSAHTTTAHSTTPATSSASSSAAHTTTTTLHTTTVLHTTTTVSSTPETTTVTAPPASMRGEILMFGRYEQDNDPVNGAELIRWVVLDETADSLLLLSCSVLDARSYHTAAEPVTWETCELRGWLNTTFREGAFSEEEIQQVLVSTVINEENPVYHTPAGQNTLDWVFLLSLSEAELYLPEETLRGALATPYAVEQGVSTTGDIAAWWLRSPGSTERMAAVVPGCTAADAGGTPADGSYLSAGVRPCIRIRKPAVTTAPETTLHTDTTATHTTN